MQDLICKSDVINELAKLELNYPEEATFENAVRIVEEMRCQIAWYDPRRRMPEEHSSIFRKLKGTDKWHDAMWLRQSDTVLVTAEFKDGTRRVETSMTRDGQWHFDVRAVERKVVAWTPLPMPMED